MLELHHIYRSFADTQVLRKSFEQRGQEDFAESLKISETKLVRLGKRELKKHPLFPWLHQYKGLGGIYMIGVLGMLRDPRRFPGQPCTKGHYLVPEDVRTGDPCPEEVWDDERNKAPCTGVIEKPRSGTGVRSVWHYSGLHVVDGKMPMSRRGKQNTWRKEIRTCFLMPEGIVDSVIRQRTLKYRDLYDGAKARLFERPDIVAMEKGRAARAHYIARMIVAKAIEGDLLTEWKRVLK